jgi:hypothetical protein
MPADVEEFDGEDVGGALEFLLGEELRRRFSQSAGPPMNDVREASKVGGFRGFEDAEQVEIGLMSVIVAAGGGAIQNDGLKIVACGFSEAPCEFDEFFVVSQHFILKSNRTAPSSNVKTVAQGSKPRALTAH